MVTEANPPPILSRWALVRVCILKTVSAPWAKPNLWLGRRCGKLGKPGIDSLKRNKKGRSVYNLIIGMNSLEEKENHR